MIEWQRGKTPNLMARMIPAKDKNMFFKAVALGAGLCLLLQVVAYKLFSSRQDVRNGPPLSLITTQSHHAAVERPDTLFNDEFFSSPFMIDSELMALKNEMDRQMQQFDQHLMGGPFLRGSSLSFWQDYDIMDQDNQVTVVMPIAEGIQKDDIHIEVIDGSVIHILGGRQEVDDANRSMMNFEKQFALGRNIEQDGIAANLKDGKLTVSAPKAGHHRSNEKKEIREIPIKVEL